MLADYYILRRGEYSVRDVLERRGPLLVHGRVQCAGVGGVHHRSGARAVLDQDQPPLLRCDRPRLCPDFRPLPDPPLRRGPREGRAAELTGCRVRPVPPRIGRIVDLSRRVDAQTQVYPGDPHVRLEPATTLAADGVNVLAVHLGSHSGTHVDAPFHFIEGGERMTGWTRACSLGPL